MTINVKANEKTEKERSLDVPMPNVLKAQNLDELVAITGAEMVFNKTQAQLKIDFRAKIRNLLSATEGEGDAETFKYDDESILAKDFTNWIPEGRKVKTPEEKIKEAMGNMSPEEAQQALKDMLKELKKG